MPGEPDDDIADPDPGRCGRRAREQSHHYRAFADSEPARGCDRLHLDAQERLEAPAGASGAKTRKESLDAGDGNREPDVLRGRVPSGRRGRGSVHADDLTAGVDEGPAGVARVDGRLSLQEALQRLRAGTVLAACLDGPSCGRDDPFGDRRRALRQR